MKDGKVVGLLETEEIFENPQHEYTKALVRYSQYKSGKSYKRKLLVRRLVIGDEITISVK